METDPCSDHPPASGLFVRPRHNRRASARVPIEATIEVLEPCRGSGVAINRSVGGIRIAVSCHLESGMLCVLQTSYATGPQRVDRARVVWSRSLRDGCIAGLQLLDDN